eukprot:m.213003 g.213003  ORF g.213003 m.213003 type:complete len:140 (+) comp15513_c0_seq1:265-684(+)
MADAAADQPHDVDVLVTFEHRKADSLAKLFESVSASDPQAIRFEGIDTATPVLWIKDRRLVGRHVGWSQPSVLADRPCCGSRDRAVRAHNAEFFAVADAVGTNLLFRVGTEADKKELKCGATPPQTAVANSSPCSSSQV